MQACTIKVYKIREPYNCFQHVLTHSTMQFTERYIYADDKEIFLVLKKELDKSDL